MAGAFFFLYLGYGVQNNSKAFWPAIACETRARVLNLVLKYFKYILSDNPIIAIIFKNLCKDSMAKHSTSIFFVFRK
jgi:hypothetical protein